MVSVNEDVKEVPRIVMVSRHGRSPVPIPVITRPRKRLSFKSFNEKGRCTEDQSLRCAEVALSTFNSNTKSGHPKYELVKALGCMDHLPYVSLYHCNFIARPKDGSEDEDMLFFAEVQGGRKKEGRAAPKFVLTCVSSRILGPSSLQFPGHSGCKGCDRFEGYVKHPKSGFEKDAVRTTILSKKRTTS